MLPNNLQMLKTAPNKERSGPSVNSAKAEKPCYLEVMLIDIPI